MGCVRLSYSQGKDIAIFTILNIQELDNTVLEKLIRFSWGRDGEIDYDTKEIKIKRRWDIDIAKAVFKQLGIEVCFEKIAAIVPLYQQEVLFGAHKGKTWQSVPSAYLDWMLSNAQEQNQYWNFAYAEKKRREFEVNFNIEEIVNFGKYKGSKWVDVPMDYLKWLSENLKDDNPNRVLAQAAFEYKRGEEQV